MIRLRYSASIGYGQPCSTPSSLQDIAQSCDTEDVLALNKEIDQRLKVAEFCAKVTSLLYYTMLDGRDPQHPSKSIIFGSLAQELRALETKLEISSQGKIAD